MRFVTEHFQHLHLQIYAHKTAQAQALAAFVAGSLKHLLKQQDTVLMAVSGGSSPILFFQILSHYPLPWARIRVTLVDERIVAPDSEQSNTQLVHTYLLQNQAQQALFLPWITAPQNEHSDLLFLQKHLPPIDLAILGLGQDGHTASWLPKSVQLTELLNAQQPETVLRVESAAHFNRFSLTASALERIPQVLLQFSGIAKQRVFQAALLKAGVYPVETALPFIQEVFISP